MIPAVLHCPRCADVELEAHPEARGALRYVCHRCQGSFVEATDLEAVVGGTLPAPHDVGLPNPFSEAGAPGLACPVCGRPTLDPTTVGELDAGVRACPGCGGHFFEAAALAAVRRMASLGEAHRISTFGLELDERALAPKARPSTEAHGSWSSTTSPMEAIRGPVATTSSPAAGPSELALTDAERRALFEDDERAREALRLPYDEPYSLLLTLPLSLLLGLLLSSFPFGRLLAMPFRIQFHELGHAIPAWLSGRMALPLPCGFTFWSEEPSFLTHLLVLAFSGMLVFHGLRERRYFAVIVAGVIEALHLLFAVLLSTSATVSFVILDGCAGEMWLASFVLVSFYFRAPDRFRWDFFRFLFVVPAAITLVDALRMWVAVQAGREQAPVGSIMGTVGDGTGDLERLMNEHGYALPRLVKFYAAFGTLLVLVVLAVYAVHAWAAVTTLRRRDAGDA